jgi:hypothetical protein
VTLFSARANNLVHKTSDDRAAESRYLYRIPLAMWKICLVPRTQEMEAIKILNNLEAQNREN